MSCLLVPITVPASFRQLLSCTTSPSLHTISAYLHHHLFPVHVLSAAEFVLIAFYKLKPIRTPLGYTITHLLDGFPFLVVK